MSDDESETSSLDYAKFERETTQVCSDFATYAAALLNHLGTSYTPDFHEVALGMGHASNQVSALQERAAWRKLEKIFLHFSDQIGVIALPNLFNLDIEKLSLQDILQQLEHGPNLTKTHQSALWRFITEHVFRDIPRPVFREARKRGIPHPKSQMDLNQSRTFLLVPPIDESFSSFIIFVARFKAINPFWNPSEDIVKKAWCLSLGTPYEWKRIGQKFVAQPSTESPIRTWKPQ
ncbi:MAG: hypothetical protein Q9187_006862 [Circinaria calcarea]